MDLRFGKWINVISYLDVSHGVENCYKSRSLEANAVLER